MDIRHSSRAAMIVMAALLLVTFAFVVAPVGGKAFAAETAKTTAVAATTTAAPAESAEAATGEGKEGAAATEKEAEIPHKVGNPTPAQLQDLRYAWASIPGFDLLLVSILGMIVTFGVIAFGAFKQSRV